MSKLSLRIKMELIGVALVFIPLLTVNIITSQLAANMKKTAMHTTKELVDKNLGETVHNLWVMCQAPYRSNLERVQRLLPRFTTAITKAGGLRLDSKESVTWEAVNQFNQTTTHVTLPKMLAGSTWLGQNTAPSTTSPVIDDAQAMTSGLCTIFQRMNEAGDMLRISTTVVGKNGKRAIGTYIPAQNPDGQTNPVIAAILKGENYTGRAFVVDQWCMTAYGPVRDGEGKVIGMLFTGLSESGSMKELRDTILKIQVGKTGYAYALHAMGEDKGQYVISKDGKRDGENIWDSRDASGNYFIHDICNTALKLQAGETAPIRYPWKNAEDPVPKMKLVRLAYFAPWDLVLGVGAPEEELFAGVTEIEKLGNDLRNIQIIIGIVSVLIASGLFSLFSHFLVKKLSRIVGDVDQGAEQVGSASRQLSISSQESADGASQQAASIEETSASVEELTSMTRRNTENAQQGAQKANRAREETDESVANMSKLSDSMTQMAKIIKSIDEIAFQTNILALNAAVEAARAGEAGMGFAVVADEVRNLAKRSADAARETSEKIEQGMQLTTQVKQSLDKTAEGVREVDRLVNEIATASKEQAQGIDQINITVNQMDKVTQTTASNAEETASASEELNSQAVSMKDSVSELMVLIKGKHETSERFTPQLPARISHTAAPLPAASQPKAQALLTRPRKTKESITETKVPKDEFRDM